MTQVAAGVVVEEGVVVVPQLLAELLLLVGVGQVHGAPSSVAFRANDNAFYLVQASGV